MIAGAGKRSSTRACWCGGKAARKRVELRWQKELGLVRKIQELEGEQAKAVPDRPEPEEAARSESILKDELARLKKDQIGRAHV